MNQLVRQSTHSALVSIDQAEQYLSFVVNKERYAVNILDIKEIIEITNMTNVPLTPDYIRGVINLRGNVVPVIDLSARLKNCCADVNKRSGILLVAVEARDGIQYIGMLVDEVQEILEIPKENIQPAPDFGNNIRIDFIEAMARVDEVFIVLLALNRVLSLEELSHMDHMVTENAQLSLHVDAAV